MSLKECLQNDLNIFINTDDFADVCNIFFDDVDRQINAVIDSNLANDFLGAQISGRFKATVVIYVKQGDLPKLPAVGSLVKFNGLNYYCGDVRVEQGLNVLVLERQQA